ncbi:SMC family ATPase [Thiolapillus sp.]|uniref:SMC family ATPase n=9 Tax=Thiolapillus sp. TaxID=2017437 RepID=UPI0025F8834A|nr:SMC family ATPase [Thiolapillus sp.]
MGAGCARGEKTLLVPKKATEATAEIERLTGLSAGQFRQVMVLLQGRFRELLLADSSQREDIFRQLFQTRIYTRLEQRLKDRANDVSAQLHRLDEQARGLLSGVEADDRESLVTRIERLKREVERLQEMQVKAEEGLTRSRQQVFEARNLQQQFKALETARKKLRDLQDQQQQLETDRQRWRLAEQALVLQPVYERLRRARQSEQAAQKAVEEALQEVSELQERLEKTAQLHGQMKSREPELEQLKQQQQQLKGYVGRAAQLRLALEARDAAQQAHEKCRESEERQQETVKERRRELDSLEKQYESNATLLQQLPDRQRELDALKQQQEKQSELDGLQNRLVQEQESLVIAVESKQRATKALRAAEQKQLLLEQAWEEGQAAILARQLEADSPCPVCGSTAHPHPARAGDVLPDETQRQQARERVEAARKLQQEAQSAVVAIQAKLEALTQQQAQMKKDAQALADREPAVLASEIAALTGKVEELQGLRKNFGKLKQNRSGLRQSLKAAELQQLQQENSAAAQQLAACKQDVRNKQAELPAQFADPGVLDKALLDVDAKQRTLQRQMQDAREAFEQARLALGSATATLETNRQMLQAKKTEQEQQLAYWQAALADSVFASEQAFQQAGMEEAARQQLAEAIRLRDDELLAARTLVREQTAALQDKTPPDMSALEEEYRKLDAEARRVTESLHGSGQQLMQLEKVDKRLQGILVEQDRLHREYALVGKLADVANGRNAENLSLHRFVLGVLLDDVLISARQGLLHMSKGRYQLLRREDVGDRRSSSGLDLVVEDAFSGKTRLVATLSGGESFMAALALALGLSEVVQAYAGGICLDALFIDEGFGSLDPESLDLAINTLLDLQSGGRMVGIISHVPELKERIDVRLDIDTGRTGSRVTPVVS